MAEIVGMASVDDDMNGDFVNPTLLESVSSYLGEDALSPNDLAWADSCLKKDLNASTSDWNSIKDALLDILSSQSGLPASAAAESSTQSTILRDCNFRDYVASLACEKESDEDEDFVEGNIGDIESIDISDDEEGNLTIADNRGRERGKKRMENVFRPNYNEYIEKVETDDSGINLSLTTLDVESSTDVIFKVWDLGVSDEQDDFTKQLNKGFADPPPSIEPTDDSTAWKDAMHVSVDDLIAEMGNLSLKQYAN